MHAHFTGPDYTPGMLLTMKEMAILKLQEYVWDSVLRAYLRIMEEAIKDTKDGEYWFPDPVLYSSMETLGVRNPTEMEHSVWHVRKSTRHFLLDKQKCESLGHFTLPSDDRQFLVL